VMMTNIEVLGRLKRADWYVLDIAWINFLVVALQELTLIYYDNQQIKPKQYIMQMTIASISKNAQMMLHRITSFLIVCALFSL
jgi:hypothetical protein